MYLRQKLNRSLTFILSVIFLLHWATGDWVIRTVAEKQMVSRLKHDSDSLKDTLKNDRSGHLRFDSFHIGSIYNEAFSGHYFVIKIDGVSHYSASLQNQALELVPRVPTQANPYHYPNGPKDQPLLVLESSFEESGHIVSISVAEDLSAIIDDLTSFRIGYLAFSTFILIVVLAIQSTIIKRAFKPFTAARRQLTEIVNGEHDQIEVDVPAEIRPLVDEFNRLLVLIIRRLQQSRTAIGNLAHALKTPLAMLFRITDNPVISADPELHQLITQQTNAIHLAIERELKRARIAGNEKTKNSFNPFHELTTLSQLLQNVYSEKQLQFKITAPDIFIHYDREDLLELIGNLLDNACKWAKDTICVTITLSNMLVITIEDDGPGINDQNVQLLTYRGLRLDETVDGHGLGLAIVHDITEFYGGSITFDASEKFGGFMARVRLPLN